MFVVGRCLFLLAISCNDLEVIHTVDRAMPEVFSNVSRTDIPLLLAYLAKLVALRNPDGAQDDDEENDPDFADEDSSDDDYEEEPSTTNDTQRQHQTTNNQTTITMRTNNQRQQP